MRKLIVLALISLSVIACQQGETRYTQTSAEIDSYKALVADYEAGNWEAFNSHFVDTAHVFHNTVDKHMSPADNVAGHKERLAALSSYSFDKDEGDYEMVVTDKGETWVNFWGVWQGTITASQEEFRIPVHITAQFVDGKIVKEYGYWDNAPMTLAMQAIQAAAEAAAEGASEEAGD